VAGIGAKAVGVAAFVAVFVVAPAIYWGVGWPPTTLDITSVTWACNGEPAYYTGSVGRVTPGQILNLSAPAQGAVGGDCQGLLYDLQVLTSGFSLLSSNIPHQGSAYPEFGSYSAPATVYANIAAPLASFNGTLELSFLSSG
jgi:hypothetical protein